MLNINSCFRLLPHSDLPGWTWGAGCPGEGAGAVSGERRLSQEPGDAGKGILELAPLLDFPDVGRGVCGCDPVMSTFRFHQEEASFEVRPVPRCPVRTLSERRMGVHREGHALEWRLVSPERGRRWLSPDPN